MNFLMLVQTHYISFQGCQETSYILNKNNCVSQ